MTDSQIGSRRQPASRPQSFIAPVCTTAVLVLLAGVGAWLLHFGTAGVLAAMLAILVLASMTMVIRTAFPRRRDNDAAAARQAVSALVRDPVSPSAAAPTNSSSQDVPGPSNGKRWSLDVFANMDAQRFAAVCETWFSWAGFDTRSESHRTSEGVDIWLHAAKMPGPVAIVRCKHWLDKPVGLQEMKEFMGLVESVKSAHGTYTTTSTYTPEALQFAKEHGIDAVDGRGLLRKIQTRTRQSQQALLAVAYDH